MGADGALALGEETAGASSADPLSAEALIGVSTPERAARATKTGRGKNSRISARER
jgi:hypothetical protein